MGLMGRILGIGRSAGQIGEAVGSVAEVFVGNAAERDEHLHERRMGTLDQLSAEFAAPRTGAFDAFVNGLNRLPRPLLALGTIGLFVYAMAEPLGFARRMEGLAAVPQPLWWLLGAIVSFYFGARELHHQRNRTAPRAAPPQEQKKPAPAAFLSAPASLPKQSFLRPKPRPKPAKPRPEPVTVRAEDPHFNAAVVEWRSLAAR